MTQVAIVLTRGARSLLAAVTADMGAVLDQPTCELSDGRLGVLLDADVFLSLCRVVPPAPVEGLPDLSAAVIALCQRFEAREES